MKLFALLIALSVLSPAAQAARPKKLGVREGHCYVDARFRTAQAAVRVEANGSDHLVGYGIATCAENGVETQVPFHMIQRNRVGLQIQLEAARLGGTMRGTADTFLGDYTTFQVGFNRSGYGIMTFNLSPEDHSNGNLFLYGFSLGVHAFADQTTISFVRADLNEVVKRMKRWDGPEWDYSNPNHPDHVVHPYGWPYGN